MCYNHNQGVSEALQVSYGQQDRSEGLLSCALPL